jgi:nicotinamidase-related amidase/type 1 glutamine amidotransferase
MKFPLLLLLGVLTVCAPSLAAGPLAFRARARVQVPGQTNTWQVRESQLSWAAPKTAVVVCDMWDKHHCPDATARVGEMAPRMNEVLKAARKQGALIIHCPSDTLDFYKDHPGRKLAQAAPKVVTTIPLEGWCSLKPDREAPLPIDDSDGGCDGCPDCPSYKAWSRQHPALEIMDGDAITDSAEAYYLMRQRGITNVIVMGVHINMCVLGRPFSIRQLVRQGQNVVLMRDLTDSMYNHRKAPFVSHFRGTELVVEHIEKYWCPSITSADLLGGDAFRFQGHTQKEVCFILGENEYQTGETLPAFAQQELAWRGYTLSFVTASTRTDDFNFRNWEAISRADTLVISTRRRATPKPMMDALRAHVAAGKAVVGLRTASHAFELRDQQNPADTTWANFDTEVLGADYQDHYGKGPGKDTLVHQITETAGHPILSQVDATFRSPSHLYKSRTLLNTVTPLLRGQTEDGRSEVEPIAWINTRENRRVFYTSLGAPEDFAEPNFRRLLLNGILWSLDEYIAPGTPKPVDYSGAWQTLKVPGTWDDNSQGRLAQFDGFAWYRCWAKIPNDWPAEAQFALEQLDDAGEVYFDGQRLGAVGTLPPNYTSGLGPEKTFAVKVTPGASHFVAVRVFDHGGRGGFKGRAPELSANGQALRLDGEWQFRTGDNLAWASPTEGALGKR